VNLSKFSTLDVSGNKRLGFEAFYSKLDHLAQLSEISSVLGTKPILISTLIMSASEMKRTPLIRSLTSAFDSMRT
jgi:hypothetical protein